MSLKKFYGTMIASNDDGRKITKSIEGISDRCPADKKIVAGKWTIEVVWSPADKNSSEL